MEAEYALCKKYDNPELYKDLDKAESKLKE